jgi:hypothetical protein
MNKFDHKWIMYHELHHRHRNGMTPPQIASFLGMDTRTVKKLLAMSEQGIDFQQHYQLSKKSNMRIYQESAGTVSGGFLCPSARLVERTLPKLSQC